MKVFTTPLLRVWAWQKDAACRGMDSSVFFSPVSERGRARRRREEEARTICRACPVSGPCGRFAHASQQEYGVWGGYTESERRSIKRVTDRT
ncbi:WhiB family transcriptional regulator [Streptomyces cocklensis]|uniref:WhiB family transcriptional regulator n=1 Tax=Actinacidiphila cocklensis TaxID=887465 RepID=UPI00203F2076|nr:WhiB family transcriptional regulator [Actinacidiphila cocklensis]MDD1058549.1 WhiB family transcriptional regulator [Actinacidiphila cocklensis]WSX75243.1 WhiB family transcriptional regulator [Streptomyces sp. NBC_00899]